MKRLPLLIAVTMVLATAMLVSSVAANSGNGIDLNGKHFTLNLIGAPRDKDNMPGNLAGHTIFVEYTRGGSISTKILLTEGDFAVIDKDGTDGEASFQLPYPHTIFGGSIDCYEVWAKALGKPEGEAFMKLCRENKTNAADWECAVATISIKRPSTGKNLFQDITQQLTHTPLGGALFGDTAYYYYWDYLNNGLKHAQLRFYQTAECADAGYS